jgi:hypothetical protein
MKTISLVAGIVLAGFAAAQDWESEVSKKVAEIESQAAKQNAALRVDALLDAAAQVKDTHPELSQRLATRALNELNKDKDVPISWRIANNVVPRPHELLRRPDL